MADIVHPDPRYDSLAATITNGLEADQRVRCLLLTGSLGSDDADPYSDLDLTVVVGTAEDAAGVAAALPALVGDTVLANFLPSSTVDHVFTAITADWLRLDVLVTTVDAITSRPAVQHHVVFDRDAIASRLTVGVHSTPDPTGMVVEFIRRLGLLDVVAGRAEFVVAAHGALGLREMLVELLRTEQGLPAGSIKHLSRDLDVERYALLTGLPPVAYDATAVEAQLATARAFLPRARTMLGAEWPTSFAQATREHLRRRLDVDVRELTE